MHQSMQRLQQDDLSHALRISSELNYEDGGGPGIERSPDLLQYAVEQPIAHRLALLRMQACHYPAQRP